MSAFPQLIHGRLITNSVTTKSSPPIGLVLDWWRSLSDNEKFDLIIKLKPMFLTGSSLLQYSLWTIYNKNPTELFDLYTDEELI